MTIQEKQRLIDDAVARLSEHFDAVEIVAAHLEPDGHTRPYFTGRGLWHARIALCQEFVDNDKQIDQAREIAEHLKRQ